MQGERLPDNVIREFAKPGSMWRERIGDGPWQWCIRDPHGDFGTLGGYDVYEHDDRTISVRGEVRNYVTGAAYTLEQGKWTEIRPPRAAA